MGLAESYTCFQKDAGSRGKRFLVGLTTNSPRLVNHINITFNAF